MTDTQAKALSMPRRLLDAIAGDRCAIQMMHEGWFPHMVWVAKNYSLVVSFLKPGERQRFIMFA